MNEYGEPVGAGISITAWNGRMTGRALCRFIMFLSCSVMLASANLHAGTAGPEPQPAEDSLFYIKARLIDSVDRSPVAFAHIINYNLSRATISDTLGYFYIRVQEGDTIIISAIGYKAYEMTAHDSLRDYPILPELALVPFRYPISGVNVNPLRNYDYFKRRMVEMKLPEYGYRINESVVWDIELGTDTLDMVPTPILSPVTALYNWLSKEGKSNRKLQALIEQEQFEEEVAYKYSPEIVSRLTGYSGFELHRFLDFCSFGREFLRQANYLEIASAIMEKKKAYERLK